MTSTTDDPLDLVCSINLAEADYVRAGLRPRPRKKLSSHRQFDREEVVQRIMARRGDRNWNHPEFDLDHAMSREEAFLWLTAIQETTVTNPGAARAVTVVDSLGALLPKSGQSTSMSGALGHAASKVSVIYEASNLPMGPVRLQHRLLNVDIPDTVDVDTVGPRLSYSMPKIVPYLLFRVATPTDLGRCLARWVVRAHTFSTDYTDYIRVYVLPYASDDEVERMRHSALAELSSAVVTKGGILKLLLLLGEREAPANWILSFKPGTIEVRGHISEIRSILLSCGDSKFALDQMTRLNIGVTNVTEARTWLALAQSSGLSLLLRSMPSSGDAAGISAVARVIAPEVAPHLLKWQSEGMALATCQQWFEAHPGHAAAGLKNLVAGSDPDIAAAAIGVLNSLVRRGSGQIIEAHLKSLPSDVYEKVAPAIFAVPDDDAKYEPLSEGETPDALKVKCGPDSQSKPGDILPSELPPLTIEVNGELRRLTDAQFFTLIHALAKSKAGAPKPYVTAVRSHSTAQSRDAFAWALLQNWLDRHGSPREKWKFIALGHIGGDACALKLLPLIREWPGQGHYTWALTALKCLEDIGTDTALMQLTTVAQKSAFKGRQEEARKSLEAIAVKRGFTRAELEDRIAPDCELDATGSRIFDLGSRQFALSLNPEIKPVLREVKDGQVLPNILKDLPIPNQKDDPVKSENAASEWKTLKKKVAAAAKVQASRLEEAMIASRRWSPGDFDRLLVRHPLMTNLIRRLVCAAFDENGTLIRTFRVTEDCSLADANDTTYEVPEFAKIGIAHPRHMAAEEIKVWHDILNDYEIVSPFPQLGRPVYLLTDDELDDEKIDRFNSIEIPCALLVFTLDKRNWVREKPKDSGWFNEHSKLFDGAGISAVIAYDPGTWGGSQGDPQHITEVYFYKTGAAPGEIQMLPLRDIDSIIVSEVLADLQLIVSKVK